MTTSFERFCELIVANGTAGQTVQGLSINGLRTSFKLEASNEPHPNNAEISIYNLSETSRSKLQKRGVFVQFKAGYKDNNSILFSGNVRYVDHVREGADWVSKMRLGDGENFYLFDTGRFSFKPGTPTATIIETLASRASNLRGLGNIQQFLAALPSNMATYPNGYTSNGTIYSALVTIAASAGWSLSIQNGVLNFVHHAPQASDFTEKGELLSPDTGLIGSPEHGSPCKNNNMNVNSSDKARKKQAKKNALLKVKCLLNPRIKCGGVVQIDSLAVKGSYFVDKLEHTGDTHGGDWYTQLEVKPLV